MARIVIVSKENGDIARDECDGNGDAAAVAGTESGEDNAMTKIM